MNHGKFQVFSSALRWFKGRFLSQIPVHVYNYRKQIGFEDFFPVKP